MEFRRIGDADGDAFSAQARRYGVQFIPTVIVIDAAGEVVLEEVGISDKSAYRDLLVTALEEAMR